MAKRVEDRLRDVLAATGEVYGKVVSKEAATMYLADLIRFSPEQIEKALQKCRQELKFFPSPAEVIARIDDGRPGVEEAWALIPRSEADTVIWTREIAEAYALCRDQIERGEAIPARMNFKEAYTRLVAHNRTMGIPVKIEVSLGHDPTTRKTAVQNAVAKGLLPEPQALALLPDLNEKPLAPGSRGMKMLGQIIEKLKQPTKDEEEK